MGGESAVKGYAPHLMKLWKSYRPQAVTVRSVSPFEVNVVGSLFRDAAGKLRHKVVDNFWDVTPGIATGVGAVALTFSIRNNYLMSHRH